MLSRENRMSSNTDISKCEKLNINIANDVKYPFKREFKRGLSKPRYSRQNTSQIPKSGVDLGQKLHIVQALSHPPNVYAAAHAHIPPLPPDITRQTLSAN
jgi:hypothetical protein